MPIFKREVSVFKNVISTKPMAKSKVEDVLFNKEVEPLVEEYRKTKSKQKKLNLPCFIPSGVFEGRYDRSIIKHNGIICIDIDAKNNTDVKNFNKLRKLMDIIPYVAYCGLSCGGEGYFVLIPIKNPEKHREHYLSICDDFERCNITVDTSCKNVSRTRIISYDKDAYINKSAQVYNREKAEREVERKKSTNTDYCKVSDDILRYKIGKRLRMTEADFYGNQNIFKVEAIISSIDKDKIDITETERQWYEIGVALADEFGEYGREFYHRVSRYYPKYSRQETDRKFDHCLVQFGYAFGTFLHYAKEYGYSTLNMLKQMRINIDLLYLKVGRYFC